MADLPPTDAPYYDEEYETMPRARLEEVQLELLADVIPFAYEHSPLVREAWDAASITPADIRTFDDYREKVPFLTKDDVRRFRAERGDPFGGLLCVPPHQLTAINSTSGTTGEPTLVAEKWGGGFVGRPAIMYRDFWGMGVRPGDHVALVLFTFRGPTYGFVQQLGAVPLLFDYDPAEVERFMRMSLQYRPRALYNLGGVLINTVQDVAERTGLDPRDVFSSYRAVVWAGEPLGRRARALAQEWGMPLFEHSNVGDVTACFECSAHDGMHVWEDMALVEGVDPDGTDHRDAGPVADGTRCELVATGLSNRVAPLIRFRSDDIVRLDRSRCACGRTHARVWTIGRKGDEILVQGRSVLPIDVWHAVEEVDACRLGLFQVIRTAREVDTLRLRVGYQGVADAGLGAVRDELVDRIDAALGIRPEVELVPDAALLRLGPPHKIPRVARA